MMNNDNDDDDDDDDCDDSGNDADLIFPVPDLLEEMLHVDLFGANVNHPRVFEHAPWCGSPSGILLQTVNAKS